MAVYPAVIVGTDGSVTAGRAVRKAAVLAECLDVPLVVATSWTRQRPEDLGPPSLRSAEGQGSERASSVGYQTAQQTAQDGAGLARSIAPRLKVDTAVPEGEPAAALLDYAESRAGSLVVIGSKGLTASPVFQLGSVPNKVLHHPVGDVLVVRTEGDRAFAAPRTLLVGTDGSPTASRAVRRAVEVAAGIGAQVTFLSVGAGAGPERALSEAAHVAAEAGVPAATEQQDGDPASVLVERGAEHDLVVVGNRGMTGASRFLLGSVPNKVSHSGNADLLIVKTT